jgi:hypothetical protein
MTEKTERFHPVNDGYEFNAEQKYEYKIIDYQRPYKDYGAKEKTLNVHAKQGWELTATLVVPMGISNDVRIDKETSEEKVVGKKVWCIEHLYLRRKVEKKGDE